MLYDHSFYGGQSLESSATIRVVCDDIKVAMPEKSEEGPQCDIQF